MSNPLQPRITSYHFPPLLPTMWAAEPTELVVYKLGVSFAALRGKFTGNHIGTMYSECLVTSVGDSPTDHYYINRIPGHKC